MLDLDQDWHVDGWRDQDVQGTVVINLVPLLKLIIIIQVKSLATNRTGGLELSSSSHSVTTQHTIMN